MGQHIGYIRVSSAGQNTARQLDGVKLDKIFEEKESAKSMNRPVLKECIGYCREGDTLHVHSIDRLARNLSDLKTIVEKLTKEKKATVVFHSEDLTFSMPPKGEEDKPENAMKNLMFNMLGSFAEFERSLIESRRREGIAKAKAAGKFKGKQSKLTDWDYNKMKQMRADGVPVSEIARQYKMTVQGIYKALKRAEARQDLAARQGGTSGQ